MKHWGFLFVLIGLFSLHASAQEEMRVTFPNGREVMHQVIFKEKDSTNGRVLAVFASDTNQVAFSGYFVNGKPNGRFLYYHPNGKYDQTMIYGYGQLNGDYTVYDSKGNITKKGIFKNGLKHGYWKDRTNHLIGRYKKGERNLVWKKMDASGKTILEKWVYRKGKLVRGDSKTAELLDL